MHTNVLFDTRGKPRTWAAVICAHSTLLKCLPYLSALHVCLTCVNSRRCSGPVPRQQEPLPLLPLMSETTCITTDIPIGVQQGHADNWCKVASVFLI